MEYRPDSPANDTNPEGVTETRITRTEALDTMAMTPEKIAKLDRDIDLLERSGRDPSLLALLQGERATTQATYDKYLDAMRRTIIETNEAADARLAETKKNRENEEEARLLAIINARLGVDQLGKPIAVAEEVLQIPREESGDLSQLIDVSTLDAERKVPTEDAPNTDTQQLIAEMGNIELDFDSLNKPVQEG